MTRRAGWIATFALGWRSSPARPTMRRRSHNDCFGKDSPRRIEGCTALIEGGGAGQSAGGIYAMRALAYSLKGDYATAIRDYDVAIGMRPDYAVALNNRAWAHFRSGKVDAGFPTWRSRCSSIRAPPTRSTPAPTSAR